MAKQESTKRRKVRKVSSINAVEEGASLITGQQDAVIEVTGCQSNVTETSDTLTEDGEAVEQKNVTQKTKTSGGKTKRKACSVTEDSPSKKTKLMNDGFCIFVGNLNNHKKAEEISDALAQHFMTKSLLVQNIRMDRSKKHAYVDLASEMDVTKALTLNGEMVCEKPMKVEKAKIKSAEKVKISAEEKRAIRDSKCLHLNNVPHGTTREDLMRIFKPVDVRFPGGTDSPKEGIAYVEFKRESMVKKIMRKNPKIKIQDSVLILSFVGKDNRPEGTETTGKNKAKGPAAPKTTLFVSNLPYRLKEAALKSVFKKAVRVALPEIHGKKRGFAFVEFATVAEAEKALKSTENMKIRKREIRAEFCQKQKSDLGEELMKTLIVTGLDDKTTAETLKNAFEGAASARVIIKKKTKVSERFGFVDFESDEVCQKAKEAMEDCQIDGKKVTVAYARSKNLPAAAGGSAEDQPADQSVTDPSSVDLTGPACDAGPPEGAAAVL